MGDGIKQIENFIRIEQLNKMIKRLLVLNDNDLLDNEDINKAAKELLDISKQYYEWCLIKQHQEERQKHKIIISDSMLKLKLNIENLEEKLEPPMVLTPYSSIKMERGKALSQALSSEYHSYMDGLMRQREDRYQSMIDELPPIESPTSRRFK